MRSNSLSSTYYISNSWNSVKLPLKLNFVGASKGNPGKSCIGAVVRDHNCILVLKALYMRVPDGSNNVAEARALLEGLKLSVYGHILIGHRRRL